MINIAREAMLSIGCIQAQRCETNRCPTGVATQSKWLMRGLDPEVKSHRFANYVTVLRKEILRLSRACGVVHPTLITSDRLEIINDHFQGVSVSELFDFSPDWGLPPPGDQHAIIALMSHPHTIAKDAASPVIASEPPVEHTAP